MPRRIARTARLILAIAFVAPLVVAAQETAGTKPNARSERNRPFRQGWRNNVGSSRAGEAADPENARRLQRARHKTVDEHEGRLQEGDEGVGLRTIEWQARVRRSPRCRRRETSTSAGEPRPSRTSRIRNPGAGQPAPGRQPEGVCRHASVSKEAGDALEPFRKELADQITFLGSDLTPSAMERAEAERGKAERTRCGTVHPYR